MKRTSNASANPTGYELLSERETALLLKVTRKCLQAWRYRGDGPPFIKLSKRCIRYQQGDLQAWIEERRCMSTSCQTGRA